MTPAARLASLQRDDGSWEGEVVWCTMILSQYVIVRHATKRPVPAEARHGILHHYRVTRTAHGGWPLHPEGHAQIFTTTLAYVALRLLGVGPEDDLAARARQWLHAQPGGGVLGIPTWGKFWLSLLDLYDADGVAALPPELFLLPRWMPGHPRGWYCHTRYIYLGMAWLSASGFKAELGSLRDALRRELYDQPYDAIDFARQRDRVSETDLRAAPGAALASIRRVLPSLARAVPGYVRARALAFCLARIVYEQRTTRYQGLSPVNALLNCLALYAADPEHPDFAPSLSGVEAWRWSDGARGIRYAGARSQVWDTAFAARTLQSSVVSRQSSVVSPQSMVLGPDVVAVLRRAHGYLKRTQITEELPGRETENRQSILGGWCFSDGAHRWPVSDCAAEALTALLELERVPGLIARGDRLPVERVRDAVAFLLARQNADGGFSTYERVRGGAWLDRLNPSEMFRGCMTERSYVECTASAVEALAAVRRMHPSLMGGEASRAMTRAVAFLRGSQRGDGAFPAAWGINFTYSIFHVAKALRAAGAAAGDPALARAAAWLRRTQRPDGGWGEHFSGALTGSYVEHPRSQPVMTGWALLALAEIEPGSESVRKGVAWLQSAQQPDGSWPRDAVNGVFFGTAMLDYELYASYFPVWALARCTSA